ncbi:hypothetical protein M758_3G103100 [Ceratodon purpureus]|nr:hypothetical protein M758_3G103100 [Ceratodon purpureus]
MARYPAALGSNRNARLQLSLCQECSCKEMSLAMMEATRTDQSDEWAWPWGRLPDTRRHTHRQRQWQWRWRGSMDRERETEREGGSLGRREEAGAGAGAGAGASGGLPHRAPNVGGHVGEIEGSPYF